MKNKELTYLIDDFLVQVEKATALLEEKFGKRCILRLWGTKQIAPRGNVTDDVSYELHGVGCRVYFPDACIDFDYGPDERIDGFDSWRLYIYANEVPKKHPKYTELDHVKRDLDEYIAAGKVERIKNSMSRLYFKNNILW
ncbi:DUF6896 domain-containing protein [Pseudomonas frederiksbergensis]|uniref:DUF6896 domain-containing protein n=1 Tax=Pseudomonas frederiksbergensis TaxID=104087 RepID=UPI0013D2E2DC|nr:hypothetical protein [Pseudomonas frederiksbergensis]